MKKFFFSCTLILWGCLFVLGQLGRVDLTSVFQLNFSVAFYFYEVVIVIHLFLMLLFYPLFFFNLGKNFFTLPFDWKKFPQINFLRFFLFIILISWLFAWFNQSWSLVALLYFLRFLSYLIFVLSYFFLKKYLFFKDTRNKVLLFFITNLLNFILLLFLFFSFGQIIFFPDSRIFFILGFDNHYYRLISSLIDPNLTGLVLIIGFFHFLDQKNRFFNYRRLKKYLFYFILFLFFLALVLTFSRSSLLAFFFGWGFFLFRRKKRAIKFFIFGFFILLSVSFFFQRFGGEGVNLLRTSTIKIRIIDNLLLFKKLKFINYFIGRGFFIPFPENFASKSFFTYFRNSFGDNLFFSLINFGGFGAVGLFLFFYGDLFFRFKNTIVKQSLLIAFIIHAQFLNSFFSPFIFLLFLLVIFDS